MNCSSILALRCVLGSCVCVRVYVSLNIKTKFNSFFFRQPFLSLYAFIGGFSLFSLDTYTLLRFRIFSCVISHHRPQRYKNRLEKKRLYVQKRKKRIHVIENVSYKFSLLIFSRIFSTKKKEANKIKGSSKV